jgi:hypothetical protein
MNSNSSTGEADDVFPGSHFRAVRNWLQRGKTFVLERLLQTLNLTHAISTHFADNQAFQRQLLSSNSLEIPSKLFSLDNYTLFSG